MDCPTPGACALVALIERFLLTEGCEDGVRGSDCSAIGRGAES